MIKEHLPNDPQKDPLITAIMTFMLPGLGQLMKGHTIEGILWALTVGFSYLIYLPLGMTLHAFCIFDAAFHTEATSPLPRKWVGKALLLLLVLILIYYVSYRNVAF